MTIYAIDWSHKEEKRAFHSAEGSLGKEPKFQDGDLIATENMPHHKVVELHNKGCLIYRCGTQLTKMVREEKSIEKTDKNDAKIIYDEFISFNKNPEGQETFRKFEYDPSLEQLSYLNKTVKDFIEVRRKMKQRINVIFSRTDEEIVPVAPLVLEQREIKETNIFRRSIKSIKDNININKVPILVNFIIINNKL